MTRDGQEAARAAVGSLEMRIGLSLSFLHHEETYR